MEVTCHATLTDARREELTAMVQGHHTLSEVIFWATAHQPPLKIADVIVQDEYTHDVVVPLRDGLCLVYDTT